MRTAVALLLFLSCSGTVREAASGAPVQPPPPPTAEAQALAELDPRWTGPRVPVLETIPGTTGNSAERCGDCHTEIAAEWASSAHARAWTDVQFQAELHKDPPVGWLCINCHTPLAAQQSHILTDRSVLRDPPSVPNPDFDPALQAEGITCLSCHYTPDGIAAVHEGVVAPHATVYTPELRSVETCTACHQAEARLEDALVCTFSTGTEWTQAAPDRTCPECHMPRITRASVPGGPIRNGGQHHWPGAGMPKGTWTPAEAALHAAWSPGITGRLEAPQTARVGSKVEIIAVIAHDRAGHLVPTGDPERHLRTKLSLTDRHGRVIGAAGGRIGQTWEWWPKAKKLDDNRLQPGETRTVAADLIMPEGPVTVTWTVEHVRIADEAADFHKLDPADYPRSRVVIHETQTISPL